MCSHESVENSQEGIGVNKVGEVADFVNEVNIQDCGGGGGS